MSRVLSPTVEFLSKTFPAFHYVVGDDGSTLANHAADAALPAAPQMRSRRQRRAPRRGRLGMSKSPSKSPDDGGVSGRGVSKSIIDSLDSICLDNMLPPPPEQTRLRPMDASLRDLGRQTVRGIYSDKRNYSRSDVGPHYLTKTNGLKRRLKKVRRANKRFNRQFTRMKRAADKLKKFDKYESLRSKPSAHYQTPEEDEARSEDATLISRNFVEASRSDDSQSTWTGESVPVPLAEPAAEELEVTDEIIRQATTRLSRAREQLRSSTAMYQRADGIIDPFPGIYDLPARPMTSSVRQRMIGGATRIDLSLDHLGDGSDEDGDESLVGSKHGKAWMGLAPEHEQTQRWS